MVIANPSAAIIEIIFFFFINLGRLNSKIIPKLITGDWRHWLERMEYKTPPKWRQRRRNLRFDAIPPPYRNRISVSARATVVSLYEVADSRRKDFRSLFALNTNDVQSRRRRP